MKLLALSIGGTPVPAPGQITTVNSYTTSYGSNLVRLGVELLLLVAVFLCVGFVLLGGFKWLTSEGDKKNLESARDTIIWAVVGLLLVFLAFLIINVLGGFFHISFLQLST